MPRLLLFLIALTSVTVDPTVQQSRDITYSAKDVVHITTKLRFTTVIVLPDAEEILDVVCGDKEFWSVAVARNLAYVKPAKAGATTNLNLVTASGAIYSFLLSEGAPQPDLKVYVANEVTSTSSTTGTPTPTRFFSSAQMAEQMRAADEARRQAVDAREAAAKAVEDAASARLEATRAIADATASFKAAYPTSLHFPYRFDSSLKPFYVNAIFHDGKFTYIRANATELPALYELKDGAPNLVSFQVENGFYVVPKVLDQGYLVIGKKRLDFETVK